jgi:hypothetical protein
VVKADFRLAALATIGMLAAGAANAQDVVNRTSTYAIYWSNSTFANADALYTASYALGASAFSDSTFEIQYPFERTELQILAKRRGDGQLASAELALSG